MLVVSGHNVARLVRSYPFTHIGLFSFILLVLPLLLDSAAWEGIPDAVKSVWRVLIIPAYLAHLLIVVIAVQLFPSGPAPAWFWGLTFLFRFVPFVLADYGLARWRRHLYKDLHVHKELPAA